MDCKKVEECGCFVPPSRLLTTLRKKTRLPQVRNILGGFDALEDIALVEHLLLQSIWALVIAIDAYILRYVSRLAQPDILQWLLLGSSFGNPTLEVGT